MRMTNDRRNVLIPKRQPNRYPSSTNVRISFKFSDQPVAPKRNAVIQNTNSRKNPAAKS